MARTKKPKVQVRRQKVSLGWAYRIYIDGTYMGTGLTQASARTAAKQMLVNYEKAKRRIALQMSAYDPKRTWSEFAEPPQTFKRADPGSLQ